MLRSKRSLKESFYPLSLLNASLGLKVFETPSGQPWLRLSIILIILRCIGYGNLIWYAEIYAPPKADVVPAIMTLYRMLLYVFSVISAIDIVLGLLQYQTEKKICKKLSLIDETLEIFGIDPKNTQTFQKNLKLIILWCLAGFILIGCDLAISLTVFRNISEALLRMFPFEYAIFMSHMVELNFLLYVSAISERFKRLNSLIENSNINALERFNIPTPEKGWNIPRGKYSKIAVIPKHRMQTWNKDFLLKLSRQIHLEMCKISRTANDILRQPMCMLMTAKFLLLTGYGYSLYTMFNDPSLSFTLKIQYCGSLGTWIFISIGRMIFVLQISTNATSESQKTSQIARSIRIPKSQTRLLEEISQLSLQIMQNPLYFTASGLIILDFGYLRGFVGTVITYLMILIQNRPDMIRAAKTIVERTSGVFTNTSITVYEKIE